MGSLDHLLRYMELNAGKDVNRSACVMRESPEGDVSSLVQEEYGHRTQAPGGEKGCSGNST